MITYNHEPFIAQAIEGVMTQQVKFPFELVVGEDCSTDKTREIIEEIVKKHPNITLLSRDTNLGMIRNFVDTLKSCSGKYVALCEGDDYWTDALKLQKQVDYLEAHPEFSICFHRATIIHENDSFKPTISNANQKLVTGFEDLASKGNFINTATCVFRNGLFREFPKEFLDAKLGDWFLHLLNAEHGNIGFLDENMSVYRRHGGGAWNDKTSLSHSIAMAQAAELCKAYFSNDKAEFFEEYLANLRTEICFAEFELQHFADVRKTFRKVPFVSSALPLRTRLSLLLRYSLSYVPPVAKFYKNIGISKG